MTYIKKIKCKEATSYCKESYVFCSKKGIVQYLVLFYAPTLIMDTDKPKIQRMQESYRNDIMTFLSP